MKQQRLDCILTSSFDSIYLSRFGLDYPQTKKTLDICIQSNDQKCLETYYSVLAARNTILYLTDKNDLEVTLDFIEKACSSEDEHTADLTCTGGIMSLSFYTSPEQDAQIISRIKKYPKKVRNIIFEFDFLWFHNRPDFKIWTNYISKADIDWEPSVHKQTILDSFQIPIEEVNYNPWALK